MAAMLHPGQNARRYGRSASGPALPAVELTLLIGIHAQTYWLGKAHMRRSMTETVRDWRAMPEGLIPLPHPSWRNTAWLRRNPWFEAEVVPELRRRIGALL